MGKPLGSYEMRFHLAQLYKLNKSKPVVEVVGVEEKLQWDCVKLN